MSLNEKLNKFLLEDKGIENIFKNISWITISAAIFKMVPFLVKDSRIAAIITILISSALLALAITSGLNSILVPFLKAIYGDREEYSQIEKLSLKSICNFQFFIYILLSILYFFLTMRWFDVITNILK